MQRQDNFKPLFENGPIRGNVYDVSPPADCKNLPTYEFFRDRIKQLLPTYLRDDMKMNKKPLSLGFLQLENFCRRMQREDGPFSQIAEMEITPEMLSEIRYGIINMYYNPATKLKFLIFKNALDAEYIESLELSIYKIKSVRLTKIFDSHDILITVVLDG